MNRSQLVQLFACRTSIVFTLLRSGFTVFICSYPLCLIALPLPEQNPTGVAAIENTEDTGNSGDTEDTGNSGDTEGTGNSGDTEDTGNSEDTEDTGNSGDTEDTGNSGDTEDTGNSGDTENIETNQITPYWQTREGVHRLAYAIENFSLIGNKWSEKVGTDLVLPQKRYVWFLTFNLVICSSNHLELFGKVIEGSVIASNVGIISGYAVLATSLLYLLPNTFPPIKSNIIFMHVGVLMSLVMISVVESIDQAFFTKRSKIKTSPTKLIRYLEEKDTEKLSRAYTVLYGYFSHKQLPEQLPSLMLHPQQGRNCQEEIIKEYNEGSVSLCLPYLDDLLIMSVSDYEKWKIIDTSLKYKNHNEATDSGT